MAPKEVFVRRSSGLIRVMSPFSAFVYNVLTMGLIFPWVYLQSPAAFPGSSLWLGILVCTFFQTFISFSVIFLASAMPRSGGDYIFQSRILGGTIGYTSVMGGFVIWILQWVALSGWLFAQLGLAPLFVTLGVKLNSTALLTVGLWCWSKWGVICISIILALFTMMFLISGFKNYVVAQWFLFGAVLVAFVLVLVVLAVTKTNILTAKFNEFMMRLGAMQGRTAVPDTYRAVIDEVKASGFNTLPKFSILATLGVAPIAWMSLQWATYSVEQGSEIKGGDSFNNQFWILVGSLWFTGILLALQGWFFERAAGREFLVAISAESYKYAAPATFSLGNISFPFPSIVVMMLASPLLIVLIGIGYMANAFQVTCNCYIGMTRDMVAMALDRTLPEWISRVHPKLHTPVNAHLAYFIGSVFWIFAYNLVPVWGTWTLGVSFACGYVFTFSALAAALFPLKAPSIYKASPGAKYGKSVIYIGGIGFLFGMASVISFIFVPNMGIAFTAPGGWKQASLVVGIILISIVFYAVSKWFHARKGINISLAFKEIPPE
jgi:APA family basic amino acid/polyamine antiporter